MNIIATNGNLLRQKRKRTGENVAKNEKQRNTCISRKYEVYLQGKNEKDFFIRQLTLRKRYENKTTFSMDKPLVYMRIEYGFFGNTISFIGSNSI